MEAPQLTHLSITDAFRLLSTLPVAIDMKVMTLDEAIAKLDDKDLVSSFCIRALKAIFGCPFTFETDGYPLPDLVVPLTIVGSFHVSVYKLRQTISELKEYGLDTENIREFVKLVPTNLADKLAFEMIQGISKRLEDAGGDINFYK